MDGERTREKTVSNENLKTKTSINKDGTISRVSNIHDESKKHNRCINMVEKSCVKGFVCFLFLLVSCSLTFVVAWSNYFQFFVIPFSFHVTAQEDSSQSGR